MPMSNISNILRAVNEGVAKNMHFHPHDRDTQVEIENDISNINERGESAI